MNNKIKGLLIGFAALPLAVGCGADANEQLVSPAAPDTMDIADEPSATPTPTDSGSAESVRVVTSTPVDVSAPFGTSVEEPDYVPVQWLVPWDDGFLAAGLRYPGQPLPDRLPPEVAELFPPEVTALFPDGLPPTQQEAIDILNEAGLLDVVMDILNEHPDAMDAVRSEPFPDPEFVAAWSSDGATWAPTEIALPDGLGIVSLVTVSGDRLTLAGGVQPTEGGDPWIMTVASTTDTENPTDTENWDTARIRLEGTGVTSNPDAAGTTGTAQTWASPIAVAADDEHWVMRVMIADDTPMSEPRAELWSGAWGGAPMMDEADQTSWILQSTSDGFLDLGELFDLGIKIRELLMGG